MPTRNSLCFLIILLLLMTFNAPAQTTAADRDIVLKTVHLLLDGWRESDTGKLETALHPDFREVTLHLQDGKWSFAVEARDKLIDMMGRIPKGTWDDQLVDPQVNIEGPIAVVWSHYRFTVRYTENGVAQSPTHCGIETFQLYRVESGWKIVNLADTHIDTCPPVSNGGRPEVSHDGSR